MQEFYFQHWHWAGSCSKWSLHLYRCLCNLRPLILLCEVAVRKKRCPTTVSGVPIMNPPTQYLSTWSLYILVSIDNLSLLNPVPCFVAHLTLIYDSILIIYICMFYKNKNIVYMVSKVNIIYIYVYSHSFRLGPTDP